jgi:hypothetical protein
MEHLEHRRIDLTAAELERLDNLARETRSRPTSGTGAYQPSWRTLIKRIAAGDILLSERIPYTLPAGLAEQAAAVEERQREQQRIAEQQRRVAQHTAQKDLVRKMPLKAVKMEQLHMELEPA